MKIKHFLSAAALCAAGTTFLLADDSLTGTVATWATTGVTGLSQDGKGTYNGVSFNIDSSDWLTGTTSLKATSTYTLSDFTITIEGNQESSSFTEAKIVLRNSSGQYVAMSSSIETLVSGTTYSWSGFTDYNGNSYTINPEETYYLTFVSSGTVLTSSLSVSSGSFVTPVLSAYLNTALGVSNTTTGFLSSTGGSTTVTGTGYKPNISISGTLTETPLTIAEDKGTLNLYLLTGQSNSLGAVKGDPLSADSLAAHKPTTTLYWHENFEKNGGVYAGASTEWGSVEPAAPATSDYSGNPCMGPEYGFAYLIEKNGWQNLICGNDGDFGIIKASLDGGGNSYWEEGGNGWSKVLTAAQNAIVAAARDGYSTINIVGLMYLQGESNTAAEAEVAGTRLLSLVDRLEAAISAIGEEKGVTITFDEDYHVAAGEPATWTNTSSTANSTTSATNIQTALADGVGEFIPTRDLTKIDPDDGMGVHYDGQSQLTIGARYAYAEALRKGLVISDKMIRNFDMDATLKDSAAFHSGTRGDAMIATWDVASATITNVGDGVVELYGMKFDYDGSDYMQTGATLIAGTVSTDKNAVDANTDRLVVGKGGITADKNVRLQTNLGIAGTQKWAIASGSTLTIDGMLFVELGTENVENALVTKTGAGTLAFSADTILVAVTLNLDRITEVGEYQFKLFEGLDGQTTGNSGTLDAGTATALSLDEDSAGTLSLAAENLVVAASTDPAALYNFEFVLLNQEEIEAELGQDCFNFSSGILTITITQIPEPSLFGFLAGTLALALAGTRRRRNRK